jgi:heme/copper-type cytochrome/quinol oxidase subunit 3
METTMTLSQLADWIIVISFFSIIGATIGHVLGGLVCMITDSIWKKLKKRKEHKTKALDISCAAEKK